MIHTALFSQHGPEAAYTEDRTLSELILRSVTEALVAEFDANAPAEDIAAVKAFVDAWQPRPLHLSD